MKQLLQLRAKLFVYFNSSMSLVFIPVDFEDQLRRKLVQFSVVGHLDLRLVVKGEWYCNRSVDAWSPSRLSARVRPANSEFRSGGQASMLCKTLRAAGERPKRRQVLECVRAAPL
jgi:hypothetical protein